MWIKWLMIRDVPSNWPEVRHFIRWHRLTLIYRSTYILPSPDLINVGRYASRGWWYLRRTIQCYTTPWGHSISTLTTCLLCVGLLFGYREMYDVLLLSTWVPMISIDMLLRQFICTLCSVHLLITASDSIFPWNFHDGNIIIIKSGVVTNTMPSYL